MLQPCLEADPPRIAVLVDQILEIAAAVHSEKIALIDTKESTSYKRLNQLSNQAADFLSYKGIQRGDRVAMIAKKDTMTIAGFFAVWKLGAILVPINPGLREDQIAHIVSDSGASFIADPIELLSGTQVYPARAELNNRQENSPAAILYTSGSTGLPKGVVLSHRNLVAGAQSVASYLGNHADDKILAALPLSFDAGLSQITTGFLVGASVVLHNYLLAQDCLRVMAKFKISGLTAVPPIWIQLAKAQWPEEASKHLRYFANTGGRMPLPVLSALRQKSPGAKPYLMYGLTEAFRSTYLPPEQVDSRPESIGKAIPNAQVLVLRPDGTECAAGEIGELVHIGPTVTLGYWRDPERTAQRFRPIISELDGLTIPSMAVWSGDTVSRDAEGYLYFVGRTDEMIKTSGYRVSPTEVEEAVYRTGIVSECIAFGVEDFDLGQAIRILAYHPQASEHEEVSLKLKAALKDLLPLYMQPRRITLQVSPFARNPNGKIDRSLIIKQAKTLP